MLKLSRISRSIITVIYVALMSFILFFALKAKNALNVKAWQIALYLVVIALFVCFYQVLKRRLNDKLKYKAVIHVYRYVYLAVILIVSRIIMVFCLKDSTAIFMIGEDKSLASGILNLLIDITDETKYAAIILNTVVTYFSSIVIKRIMLNILDNDAVATMCSVLYILSPNSLISCLEYTPSIFNVFFVLAGILLIMKIYDQITQYGLKHNLYIYLSAMLGAVVVLDILFGGSILSWLVLVFSITFITDYIDSIYVDVYKVQILQKLFRLKKNEKLAVKKSIVVFGILCCFCVFALIISAITGLNNETIVIKGNIVQGIYNMVAQVKWQYILGCIVVILFEIIGIFMRRNSNAKVSFMQLALIVFSVVLFFNTNVIYDSIFCICSILTIGNIYYNRNEKIKLLKEKN